MRTVYLTALRVVAGAAVLASAAVHLYIYRDGFSAIPVIGPLFLANVIGGGVIAVMVGFWKHWIPAVLTVGYAATTVVAYWISVWFGLFGIKEVTSGWPQTVAQIAEYLAIASGTVLATARWRRHDPRRGMGPRARARTSSR